MIVGIVIGDGLGRTLVKIESHTEHRAYIHDFPEFVLEIEECFIGGRLPAAGAYASSRFLLQGKIDV